MVLLTIIAVALVAGVGGGVVYLIRMSSNTRSAAPQSTAPATTTPVAPRTSIEPTEAATPAELLADEVDRDHSTVESVVGYWVPQISSKAVGTSDNGIVYDESAIWEEVESLKATYSDAVVLRSDSYSSFKSDGFWVIIVAEPFETADDAISWCSQAGRSADDCFAKRLSHTEGPQGNTVHR
jgi:hypothetical protein